MSRRTETFLPTLKDDPADAESISHRLMVRAGLVRQLGAGLWTYLPAGWRSHRKVEQIIREEMDAIGGQEMSLPVLQPAELWKQTGRYEIEELFKLQDRKGSELVLGMTHEEPLTCHIAHEVRSYRDLPLILYQLQTKERDEPRPRAGVLRTREFVMKDAYSFDRDEEGLERSYALHIEAYDRIFDRCGLDWYRVASDVGMMGGSGAHEYMAPCAAGENEVALAPGYAANVEIASADPQPVELPEPLDAPEQVETPGLTTVEQVSGALGVAPGALLKAMPVVVEGRRVRAGAGARRSPTERDQAPEPPRRRIPAGTREEIAEELGPVGFVGPVRPREMPVLIKDAAIQGDSFVSGANEADAHLRGVRPGRDFEFQKADVRVVEAGTPRPAATRSRSCPRSRSATSSSSAPATRSRSAPTTWTNPGKEQPIVMGSYGIGPARIIAAAIEQGADERGIVWPRSLAPWQVQLVSLAKAESPSARSPTGSTRSCFGAGSRSSTTTAMPARARSSPTPSCSAARCGWWSAAGARRGSRSRPRSAPAARSAG